MKRVTKLNLKLLLICLTLLAAGALAGFKNKAEHKDSADNGMPAGIPAKTNAVKEMKTASLPEGVTFTGMKYYEWTTALGQHQTIIPTAEGYDVYITWYELPFKELDGDNYDSIKENDKRGKVSCKHISKEEGDAFFKSLINAGAVSLDGYSQSKSLGPNILDGDHGFELKLLKSDGTVLKASAYNTVPKGFNNLSALISEFFRNHEDYSAYYPVKFPDAEPSMLTIEFGSPYTSPIQSQFKIELVKSRNQWSVIVKDPRGKYIDRSIKISDYSKAADLPFKRFVDILKKHDMGQYNNVRENWNSSSKTEYFRAWIVYDGTEQEYETRINLPAEKYRPFIEETIQEIIKYCKEVKKD